MKLICSFETIDMGEEYVAVPVGEFADRVRGVFKLNDTGLEILELLNNDMNEEQIVSALSYKYDDERSIITEYVHNVIDYLDKNELIK